jgi:hypothetical protein
MSAADIDRHIDRQTLQIDGTLASGAPQSESLPDTYKNSVNTVPKDSENFATDSCGDGRLFPATNVFVIYRWRLKTLVISNKMY